MLNLVPENPNSTRQGIDVGTGASCIYPLLGNALYGWKFDATDIDEESVDASLHLIQLNHLEEHIRVHKRTPEQPLLTGIATAPITFSMCNPPFFSNADEVSKLKSSFVFKIFIFMITSRLKGIHRQTASPRPTN